MITDQYLQCLKDLQNNPNIEIGGPGHPNNPDCEPPSERFLERRKQEFEDENITISDSDLEFFNLTSVAIGWASLLEMPGIVLKGGFIFNGITDALIYPTDDFKHAINIKDDGDYSQKLGWFEYSPSDYYVRGCFIKEEGTFPPPIALFNEDWYVKLDFDYHKYMELLFENYGFKGWQYFYIDIVKEMPRLGSVIEDMEVAVKTLPLLFPDKDWSYHQKRYEDVLQKISWAS